MSSIRRNTAVGIGCAVLALIVGTTAWAQDGNDFAFTAFADGTFFTPEFEAFWQDDVTVERLRAMERAMEQSGQIRVGPGNVWRLRSSSSNTVSRVLAHAEDIGLTDDQENQIRDLQRGMRRQQIRRDADLEIAEMDLEEMMDDDGAGLDAIEQKMREVANLGVDARMEGLRLERDVMATLTAEQRDELDDLMPERVLFQNVIRQRRR